MKDKVRESLFNIVGPRVKGMIAIDLFAGTGAVSFEAISRGVTMAYAIEKNRRAVLSSSPTAESLGVEDKMKNYGR